MDAAQITGFIVDLIEGDSDHDLDDSVGGPDLHGARVELFGDAGVMTRNEGFVIQLRDGSEFQITIIQSKEAIR